jgi:hypothetical protein
MFGESTPLDRHSGSVPWAGTPESSARWVDTQERSSARSLLRDLSRADATNTKTLMWGCLLPHLETGSLIKR